MTCPRPYTHDHIPLQDIADDIEEVLVIVLAAFPTDWWRELHMGHALHTEVGRMIPVPIWSRNTIYCMRITNI